MSAGKGDKRRPGDEKKYRNNYEKIFSVDGKKFLCSFQTSVKKQHEEWSKEKKDVQS